MTGAMTHLSPGRCDQDARSQMYAGFPVTALETNISAKTKVVVWWVGAGACFYHTAFRTTPACTLAKAYLVLVFHIFHKMWIVPAAGPPDGVIRRDYVKNQPAPARLRTILYTRSRCRLLLCAARRGAA